MKSEFGHGPSGPELGLMTTWKGTDGLALATLNRGSQAPRFGVNYVQTMIFCERVLDTGKRVYVKGKQDECVVDHVENNQVVYRLVNFL